MGDCPPVQNSSPNHSASIALENPSNPTISSATAIGVREQLRKEFREIRRTQQQRRYQKIWCFHALCHLEPFTLAELHWIAARLGYKPAWAQHKYSEQCERQSDTVPHPLGWAWELLQLRPPFSGEELEIAYRRVVDDSGGNPGKRLKSYQAYTTLCEALAKGGAL